MKRYAVTIPCTMSLYVEVEAESKEEAIEIAFEIPVDFQLKKKTKKVKDSNQEIVDFGMHEIVVQGNVFRGVQNEIYIDEID